ncbi:MAG: 6-pyruvoyl tetrahydropterin synthase family protein [Planctomycetales bacterium]|nr:6-pyruvoyl tetrahydropterin synthase family protein [Planctomycetales bacterium]
MAESYAVRVTKDYLVFSAAHFITFDGNICERLHGHNYQVEVEVFGPVDDNHYVIDFIALRDALHSIVLELDHRVILPRNHQQIRVIEDEREVTATFEDRRWVFPREDCRILPVANTTTELLAGYIGHRLLAALDDRGIQRPERIRVAVDENFGQWGICEIDVSKM